MKNLFLILSLILSFTNANAVTTYETVVTDQSFSSTSKVVITEEQIKNSKASNLTSLLQTQANMTVANSNVQPNSIFIRGGDSSHVLILVDGVPFYDGTTSQKTFDLNSLDIRGIRKIEILKGSQSVLYGGQALSGVIKIDTIPRTLETKSKIATAGGSNNLQLFSGYHLQNLSENDALTVRGSYLGKSNKSAVSDSDYRYPSRKKSAELSYIHKADWEFLAKALTVQDISEVTGSDPAGLYLGAVDDKDYRIMKNTFGAQTVLRSRMGAFRPQFVMGYTHNENDYHQFANSLGFTDTNQIYKANTLITRFDLRYQHSDLLVFDTGAQFTFEDINSNQGTGSIIQESQEFKGLFLKAESMQIPLMKIEVGGRLDTGNLTKIESTKDLIGTYQLGLTFFENTRFEYSTGFKSASLYQLYGGGTYSNPSLKSERSTTLTASQDFPITSDQLVSFTYFDTTFTDMIQASGSPTRYQNIGKTQTRGVEAEYSMRLIDTQLQLSVGYQEPRDIINSNWLLRRPLQTAAARVSHKFSDQDNLTLEYLTNGSRRDQTYRGPTRYANIGSFALWNLAYSYDVTKQTSIFSRVTNALDSSYEEQAGYFNEGRAFQVGLEMSL